MKPRSQRVVALAVELYGKLKSTQKVARRLDLAVTTTYRILKDAGVEMPGRFSPEIQERKKSLCGDQAKQAAVDYANGMSLADMVKKYKVGAWAIRTAATDNGIQLRNRGAQYRKFSDDEKCEMKRLYLEERLSYGQIAAQFNTSQSMIRRLFRIWGIQPRGGSAKGKDHGSWKGGRVEIGSYIGVWVDRDDPMFCMAHRTGYVLEHRLVMARALGRPLAEYETVHHLDDDKTNNKLSNLQLRFGRHGKGIVLKCRKCGSCDLEPVGF